MVDGVFEIELLTGAALYKLEGTDALQLGAETDEVGREAAIDAGVL